MNETSSRTIIRVDPLQLHYEQILAEIILHKAANSPFEYSSARSAIQKLGLDYCHCTHAVTLLRYCLLYVTVTLVLLQTPKSLICCHN